MGRRTTLDERHSRGFKETDIYKSVCAGLGKRLRRLRKTCGLTLEQAAERSGLDWKHVQKLEAGMINVTLVSLVRLAVAYEVDVRQLFPPPPKKRAPRSGAAQVRRNTKRST